MGVPFPGEGSTGCHQFIGSRGGGGDEDSDHRLVSTNQRLSSTDYQLTSPYVSTDRQRHSYKERAVLVMGRTASL
jgi:hypothetical protein